MTILANIAFSGDHIFQVLAQYLQVLSRWIHARVVNGSFGPFWAQNDWEMAPKTCTIFFSQFTCEGRTRFQTLYVYQTLKMEVQQNKTASMNESVNFSNLGSIETFEYRHTKKFFTTYCPHRIAMTTVRVNIWMICNAPKDAFYFQFDTLWHFGMWEKDLSFVIQSSLLTFRPFISTGSII